MPYSVYNGLEGLQEVRQLWDALAERSPAHVFQTTGFAMAWAQSVGESTGAQPLVVAYECDGQTVALFPACVVREGVVRLMTWLGGPHVLDYGDILFDSANCDITAEEFVSDSLRLLRTHARGAFAYLSNVREDATCYPALRSRMREFKRSTAPYVELGGDFGAYRESLGRNRRHNVDRFERRLAELGSVELAVLSAGDTGFEATVSEVLRLQRMRFERKSANAPIFDPCYEEFRVLHAENDGRLRAARLSVDDEFVAGALLCVYGTRIYYLVTAFEPRFAALGPGKLLVSRLIEYGYANGFTEFDFCWGAEPYKYFWTSREEPLVTFVADNTAGRLMATAATMRRRLTAGRQPATS